MTTLWPIAVLTVVMSLSLPGDGSAQAPHAPPSHPPVILITGSTDGLGRETALRLAETGAHLVIHGRNEERGRAVVEEIERSTPGSARFYRADLASFEEVREFARAVLQDYDRLDVLVNNAGIWGGERRVSEDGHELHFQVNYLSSFLLTRLLLPLLTATPESRIVNVSSVAQQPVDFEDFNLEQGYSDGRAYAQSKLAQVLFTFDLAEELAATGVTVTALHPATMMDTPMVLSRGATPRTSVDEGVDALLHQITGSGIQSGSYFNGRQPARANAQAYDEEARRRLRELSERLTGLAPGGGM
jgi:NAD(P)-dependent dehydrogenase (short-subunit alcohol dehydrogenase family)